MGVVKKQFQPEAGSCESRKKYTLEKDINCFESDKDE